MIITDADFSNPRMENIIIQRVTSIKSSPKRDEFIIGIAQKYILLAARCLRNLSRPTPEVKTTIVQIACAAIEKNTTDLAIVKNALLALSELRESKALTKALKTVPELDFFQRSLLISLFENKTAGTVFEIINILFENQLDKDENSNDYYLWIAALKALPEDMSLSHESKKQLEGFFSFFTKKNCYSASIHLFFLKFPKFDTNFRKILENASKQPVYIQFVHSMQTSAKTSLEYLPELISRGIDLDRDTYRRIIQSISWEEAQKLLSDMLVWGVNKQWVSYWLSFILNKTVKFPPAKTLLQEMIIANVTISNGNFNALLNKAHSFAQAKSAFEDIDSKVGVADIVSYNTLLSKIEKFEQAKSIFQKMLRNKIIPDIYSYNTLLGKAETSEQAELIFQKMFQNKITPDIYSYNTLLKKTETVEQAELIFQKIFEGKITPDVVSYSVLLGKAKTFEQAESVFREMVRSEIIPNIISYNILLNKAETFKQAESVFKGITYPNIRSYNTLLHKAETFEQAISLWHKMSELRIKYDVVSFNTMLEIIVKTKQPNSIFLELLDGMIQFRINPQIRSYKKKGKAIEPYTLNAIRDQFQYDYEPFFKWAKRQYFEMLPPDIRREWEYLVSILPQKNNCWSN